MLSTRSQLRLMGAFAALATLALAISCRGFFVNPTLTSLAIGPQNLSLTPGQSFQLVATGTFDDGSTKTVTSKCQWSSTDQSVATFSPTVIGQITAATLDKIPNPPGTTTVQATDGTVTSSSFEVTVCPVVESMAITVNGGNSYSGPGGVVLTFAATATFNGVTGTQTVTDNVTWNISNTTLLPAITNGNGTVASGTPNTPFTVTATLCNVNSGNSLTITTTN